MPQDGFVPDDGFVADGFVADKKPDDNWYPEITDAVRGVGSGVVRTGLGAYNLARKIPGLGGLPEPSDTLKQAAVAPPSTAGQIGRTAEDIGEFMLPAGEIAKGAKAIEGATAGMRGAGLLNAAGKAGLEGASAAGVAGVQSGGDPGQMARAGLTAGGTSAAISGLGAAGKFIPSANKMYRSALKPPLGGQMGRKAGNIVETGLEEGIPTSEAGHAEAGNRIDQINQQIENGIAARKQAGLTVDVQNVVKRLDDLKQRAQYMDDPQGYLDSIQSIEDKFVKGHSTIDPQTGAIINSTVPIDKAQKMKQVIGTDIRKSYGEMKSYEIEAKKNLVRGLKEEIESVFPEVKALNAREGKLIDLEEALRRFVNREGNHQLISPFTIMLAGIAGTGGVAAGHPVEGAAAGAFAALTRMAMENPEIKSRIAIAARRAAQSGIGPTIGAGAAAIAPKVSADAVMGITGNGDQQQPVPHAKGGIVAPKKKKRHWYPEMPQQKSAKPPQI